MPYENAPSRRTDSSTVLSAAETAMLPLSSMPQPSPYPTATSHPDHNMDNHNFQGQYAGFVSRFIAFSIDMIIISLIGFLVTFFLGQIIQFFGLNVTVNNAYLGTMLATLQKVILLSGGLFTTFFGLIYFLFFWTLAGFTPGKGLMGLRVIRRDGSDVTVGVALRRFFGYWVSAIVFFVGFLWVIVDRRRQGWHDKIAGTVVIYDWPSLRRRQ